MPVGGRSSETYSRPIEMNMAHCVLLIVCYLPTNLRKTKNMQDT
jgi:hypothetical protein